MLHADSAVLESQRRMARAFNLPIIWGTTPNLEGRSLSVARDANVPAIYCEYLGSARCDPAGVQAYVDGCLNVMADLGMIVRRPPFDRVRRVVEDPRDNSGHLQVCNPSPVDGYFEPRVELGSVVRENELLGVVTDMAGIQRHEMRAAAPGIVILLRTFPRVLQGESVAVVMEDLTPGPSEGPRTRILREIGQLKTGLPEQSFEIRARKSRRRGQERLRGALEFAAPVPPFGPAPAPRFCFETAVRNVLKITRPAFPQMPSVWFASGRTACRRQWRACRSPGLPDR